MKNKVEGARHAKAGEGARRAAIAREKAQIDLGESDLAGGVVDADDPVKGKGKLEPAAKADAVDKHNARARHVLDFLETGQHGGDVRVYLLACVETVELVDVGAENETALLSRAQDKTGWRVFGGARRQWR